MVQHDYTQIVKMPLLYVAGAYKSYGVNGVLLNIKKAEMVSIALIRNGWYVFTPHKNTAGYEQYHDDVLNKQTWIDMDINILERCDVLYVMDNWKESKGSHAEIAYAAWFGIPTFFENMHPANEFCPGDVYN